MAVPAKSSGGCPEKPCAWSSSSQSIRSNRSTQDGRQGRIQMRLDAKQIPAGRCMGQVGLGHRVRLAQRLRQQRTACGWCLQAAGPPLPRPPEAACLLLFISQLIHYPSEDSLISDAKQPPHHSHHAILVTALSVSDILLLVQSQHFQFLTFCYLFTVCLSQLE